MKVAMTRTNLVEPVVAAWRRLSLLKGGGLQHVRRQRSLYGLAGRLFFSVVVGIVLPVVTTELLETQVGLPETLEWGFHSLILVFTVMPVFYFLWYRPLVREMAERELAEAEVRRLSRKVIVASEEERCRLARDLHDVISQQLVALHLQLDRCRQQLEGKDAGLASQFRPFLGTISMLGDDLRNVIVALRPPLLDDLGLLPALEAHLADLKKLCPELEAELHCRGLSVRLPAELETVLFRVCQEALSNVIKHAQASQVEIWLTLSHPTIILVIEDNGIGLAKTSTVEAARSAGHFGMVGIRERVSAVGGSFRIQSAPGKGTRLRVEAPLPVKE